MVRLVKILAHLFTLLGMLVIIALPANKYSWMEGMEPSGGGLPVDQDVGSRAIFAFLFVLAIVIVQGVIALKSKKKFERLAAAAFIVLAALTWAIKFLYVAPQLSLG
jgi:hypothetical protein